MAGYAAILNSNMLGGAPLPGGLTEADIAAILSRGDVGAISAIKNLASQLDDYNNGGEDIALSSVLPPTGRANPQEAKAIANIPFGDCQNLIGQNDKPKGRR